MNSRINEDTKVEMNIRIFWGGVMGIVSIALLVAALYYGTKAESIQAVENLRCEVKQDYVTKAEYIATIKRIDENVGFIREYIKKGK